MISVKIFQKIISVLVICAAFFSPAKVQAVDAWAAAAEAVGVLAIYKSMLASMLRLGNNVDAQMAARRQDIKENGQDKNPREVQLVNDVMNRLAANSEYELRVNSLPFVWSVNDSEKFNASCYPMNYISVNRGLVRGLNLNEDEIAAVLAHEMTHGIEQHSAKNYARAMAQSFGAMMIGVNLESANVDWSKVSGMVNYSIAKSITLPAEHEADEGGFHLMTGAGFNPGGGAAAMARMNYYLRYETRDFLEFDPHDKPNEQTFSDHPDTELREEKLSKLLTDYSCGHVTVEKNNRHYKVFVDGAEVYSAAKAGAIYLNAEDAYFFAGGLAKAFHDLKTFDEWNFRTGSGNRIIFLTDDKVYKKLQDETFAMNIGKKIRDAVELAYKNETPETRENYFLAEKKRTDYWQNIRAEFLAANNKAAEKLRLNADTYNDYGQGELALQEISRAMQAENQDNFAECLAIRGRAKAICGDYDGALADTNQAVAQDEKNLYNFLNRADVYHMRGEIDSALSDIAAALKLDAENPVSYKLRAEIFDELNDSEKAEQDYQKVYELTKKNPQAVPLNYLEKIDPQAAEKIRKEKEKKKE